MDNQLVLFYETDNMGFDRFFVRQNILMIPKMKVIYVKFMVAKILVYCPITRWENYAMPIVSFFIKFELFSRYRNRRKTKSYRLKMMMT